MRENEMSAYENILKGLLSTQYFAVLSTVEKGRPYTNLVAFAYTTDLKSLIFVTNRNTSKYRNILNNRSVSLLIDSRTNKPSDINNALAITVVGSAHEEADEDKGMHVIFKGRHPYLKQFVDNAENALMVVNVSKYIIAGFDKTKEIAVTEEF